MNAVSDLDAFAAEKYLNLETYRRNGIGVRTPVWFALARDSGEPTLYVYSTADSGKAKRIRLGARVRIAPCNARGKLTGDWPTGDWITARAEIVTGEQATLGMRLLNRKYRPWKQILDLSVLLFPRHQRVMIAIRGA